MQEPITTGARTTHHVLLRCWANLRSCELQCCVKFPVEVHDENGWCDEGHCGHIVLLGVCAFVFLHAPAAPHSDKRAIGSITERPPFSAAAAAAVKATTASSYRTVP